ncbi:hypothetical protein BV20DRAFT_315504 [Pilatotrama ljubarskyi]|nr:hypothetical protein BV20DRAFT_315504 [Pilatotrama ljubarskyi]
MTNPVVSAAWQEPYRGSTSILESVLNQYIKDSKGSHYARYASITQSSGTGKSRMVDEIARKIFCIPMCLGTDQAYPPPDEEIVDMFKSLAQLRDADVQLERIQFLMCAVFETALERVKTIASESTPERQSLVSRFRHLMSEDMVYRQHGQYRRQFYADVCKRAQQLWSETSKSQEARQNSPTPIASVHMQGKQVSLMTAAEALTSYLSTIPINPPPEQPRILDIILYFDEAQRLTTSDASESGTLFPHVRRALRIIQDLPIFAVFLSTVGKLEQFSPPAQLDSSDRVVRLQLLPFRPIVWTPLDVLAQRITNDKVWTLREVASTYHIVHLGRPLFPAMYDAAIAEGNRAVHDWIFKLACQKLLKTSGYGSRSLSVQETLACIAVRIPIRFNPVQISEDHADVECALVADHMRLLLYAGAGFSPIITTSASEPFLAEAAGRLMIGRRWSEGKAQASSSLAKLDPLVATSHYLQSSLLDLGERGEFAAALFLLYARDCATTFVLGRLPFPGSSSSDDCSDPGPKYDGAVHRRIVTVCQFLEALLGTKRLEACAAGLPRMYHTVESGTTPLRTAFQEAFIYFNHFIKVRSYEVVNQAYLLLAISRGAAIICADGHIGVDIVIPVLIGTSLVKKNVTAILVQAKNSRHYGAKIQYPVFMNMNPYICGLFDRDVKEPPPVLRMVFALASPNAAVATASGPVRQSTRSSDRTAAFTAYDIWCAGASHKTFAVIQEGEDAAVASLLKLMRHAGDISARVGLGELVRHAMHQMEPLVSTEPGHTDLFADVADIGEYALAEDSGELDDVLE